MEEFFKKLGKLTRKNGTRWKFVKGDIRCLYKGRRYCPITYVARAEHGEHFNVDIPFTAAETIGLPEDETFLIVTAADGTSGKIRDKLIKACKLTTDV